MCLAPTNNSTELGTMLQLTFSKIYLLCLESCVDSKLHSGHSSERSQQAVSDLPADV